MNIDQIYRDNNARLQREMAQAELDRRTSRFNEACPPDYRDWNPALASAKKEDLAVILNWRMNPRGLYVAGQTGKCKTRACYAALKVAMIEGGLTACVLDGISFANAASKAAYNPDESEKWLKRITNADILFIDDFGKRMTKATAEAFFAVVERRKSHQRPIFITTNFDSKKLQTSINDDDLSLPILRRLRECCEVIAL